MFFFNGVFAEKSETDGDELSKAELNYTVSDMSKNIKKINIEISDKTLSDVENKIYLDSKKI